MFLDGCKQTVQVSHTQKVKGVKMSYLGHFIFMRIRRYRQIFKSAFVHLLKNLKLSIRPDKNKNVIT